MLARTYTWCSSGHYLWLQHSWWGWRYFGIDFRAYSPMGWCGDHLSTINLSQAFRIVASGSAFAEESMYQSRRWLYRWRWYMDKRFFSWSTTSPVRLDLELWDYHRSFYSITLVKSEKVFNANQASIKGVLGIASLFPTDWGHCLRQLYQLGVIHWNHLFCCHHQESSFTSDS